MAHFVAFCIGFQKNIPLQNPPGGEGGGVYGSSRSTSIFICSYLCNGFHSGDKWSLLYINGTGPGARRNKYLLSAVNAWIYDETLKDKLSHGLTQTRTTDSPNRDVLKYTWDLSALVGCSSSVSIRRIIYTFLNVGPFNYTAVAVGGKVERLV